MRKHIFFICLFCLGFSFLSAQNRNTLSGHVRDGNNGETMIGATIYIPDLQVGAYTNEYGFYSLSVPPGQYEVHYRYIGFEVDTQQVDLSQDVRVDIELQTASTTIEEVVISSKAENEEVVSTEMGVNSLNIETIKQMPVLFGETDVLKSIQLLPGVKAAGEGNSGFFVRGGGTDQNLILLDEAPVYNPSHLLGFFSVFNGDAIKSTKLYKGNMPAQYGGRLSSLLDIRMKEGNTKGHHLSGGIGLISSRLTAEGPIVKDKGSYIVSGRRTYADAFLALSGDEDLENTTLYFYDLNLKANYRLGEKDQLFLSGYFGRDEFGDSEAFTIDYGNVTGTLRWNHLFNDKLFLNSTAIFSDYDYQIEIVNAGAEIESGIRDFNLKEDLTWYANEKNTLYFGLNGIYHTFVPGVVRSNDENSFFNAREIEDDYAIESAAYFSHDLTINNKLKINYGLRGSMFTVLGPGTVYTYNAEGAIADSTVYEDGDVIKNYGGLEPRFTATYLLSPTQSIKGSYARNRQYIHLLSNSTGGTPTDLWIPSSAIVEPEIADQFSLGYFQQFPDKGLDFSIEGYYKDLQNQIEYKNGADILLNETVESQLVFGRGWSYGLEFLVRKSVGKWTGWLSYTWSRTFREFDDINDGEAFPARQDRIHDFSAVLMYNPNEKWSFSTSWVYYTGDAVTFPSGSYVANGTIVPLYTERNAERFPDYHRLDLSATWFGKNPNTNLNFSLYNAYGRKNAFSIDFRESTDNPGTTEAVKTYLFGMVPSVTWNFAF
ncbi:MAG: TonB-dependent receptor [Bacteroidota bacterium]